MPTHMLGFPPYPELAPFSRDGDVETSIGNKNRRDGLRDRISVALMCVERRIGADVSNFVNSSIRTSFHLFGVLWGWDWD